MTPQDIEKKYGFEYPILYKQLYLDGMLDSIYYLDSEGNVKLKEDRDPILFQYSDDFEVMDMELVDEITEFLRGPEDHYRKIKEKFKFIPFGQTGAGDYWGFLFNENNNEKEDALVVFLSYDPHITYLAKNFQDFFFKMLLTDMSRKEMHTDLSDDEFINRLKSVFNSRKKYLTDQQRNVLQEILKRDIINHILFHPNGYEEEARGLLTDIEMKNIFNEIIPFDKMDVTTFDYLEE